MCTKGLGLLSMVKGVSKPPRCQERSSQAENHAHVAFVVGNSPFTMASAQLTGIPFYRVVGLALAVPAVQAILTGVNLNWLAALVSPLHALCFLCILSIQARAARCPACPAHPV